MNKLTALLDDFSVNSHDDGYSLEDAINQHNLIADHANAIPKRAIEAKGWKLSSLSANYIQSNTLYRKHDTASDAKLAFWLARSQEQAKAFFIEHQGMPDFTGISKEDVREIAQLSRYEDIFTELPEILAYKGIILIYVPALEGSKIDGASFLLAGEIPVIAHAVRFNRLDNFWFTLVHELSHVCLHFKHLSTPIIDEDIWHDEGADSCNEEGVTLYDMEIEADRLTRFSFIPANEWRTTPRRLEKIESINSIAERNKVHPATIAGLIRHTSNDYRLFNDLIHSVDVHGMIFRSCN
jgi:HTH-type transcriptional regulator/antitoxin HigA